MMKILTYLGHRLHRRLSNAWVCIGNTENPRWYRAGARAIGLTIRTGRPQSPKWCSTPRYMLLGLTGVYILREQAGRERELVDAAFTAEAHAHPKRGYNYESSI